jgi:hypothetical protein
MFRRKYRPHLQDRISREKSQKIVPYITTAVRTSSPANCSRFYENIGSTKTKLYRGCKIKHRSGMELLKECQNTDVKKRAYGIDNVKLLVDIRNL